MNPVLPPTAPMLEQALQGLRSEDYAATEAILNRLLESYPEDPNGLHMLGLVRVRQSRFDEAVDYLERSVRKSPNHIPNHLNLAKVYVILKRDEDAVASFRNVLRLKADIFEAQFELGNGLQRLEKLAEAETVLRTALKLKPGDVATRASLGSVWLDQGRNAEAEVLLRAATKETEDATLLAKIWNNLGLALRNLGDSAGSLEAFETAQELEPYFTHLDALRADALDNLHRYDEAIWVLDHIIERDAQDVAAHHHYNSLLYRLNSPEFLKSFDRAQPTPEILTVKASFLLKQNRAAEALEIYAALSQQQPDEVEFLTGMGVCHSMMGDYAPGVTALEKAIARAPDRALLYGHLANTLLSSRDPQKAAAIAQRGHEISPIDQSCLALLGTAWRAMGDARDEALNGYDRLIRSFDLEPPRGFSDMASFNGELSAYLDGLHPETREFLDQSLRGGTQTLNNLFNSGHELVDRVQERIVQAVTRYIDELPADAAHPFAGRRGRGFRMAGSWSSKLRDQGFHVNHIHPSGWISSCYYVAVPDAVQDETAQQGWIKFGEPSFDAGLKSAVRRTIQPQPGRLVLFPSYMWHGTIPFQAATSRTTIAFDAVPLP